MGIIEKIKKWIKDREKKNDGVYAKRHVTEFVGDNCSILRAAPRNTPKPPRKTKGPRVSIKEAETKLANNELTSLNFSDHDKEILKERTIQREKELEEKRKAADKAIAERNAEKKHKLEQLRALDAIESARIDSIRLKKKKNIDKYDRKILEKKRELEDKLRITMTYHTGPEDAIKEAELAEAIDFLSNKKQSESTRLGRLRSFKKENLKKISRSIEHGDSDETFRNLAILGLLDHYAGDDMDDGEIYSRNSEEFNGGYGAIHSDNSYHSPSSTSHSNHISHSDSYSHDSGHSHSSSHSSSDYGSSFSHSDSSSHSSSCDFGGCGGF